jgi:uncharacterized protein
MIEEVRKIARQRYCKDDFKYHIMPVVKNALLLAEKLNADLEVVETASYLHDIGRSSEREDYEVENDHHLLGEEETRKILGKLDCDKEFIEKVAHCVLTHRGRKQPEPESLEAKIVACADAMAHFDCFLDVFYFFLKTTDSFEQLLEEMEGKMNRNWNKKLILPEAKEIAKPKYEAVKLLIDSMKEYV